LKALVHVVIITGQRSMSRGGIYFTCFSNNCTKLSCQEIKKTNNFMKKANFEKIEPIDGSSFSLSYNKEPLLCHTDFWHFHPEFEIVYVPHGSGRRFVGSTVSRFEDGDLIVLGPNIPHNAFNFGFESTGYEEYVIQFKIDQVEKMAGIFREFAGIARLLRKAQSGISFNGEAKHRVGKMIIEMYGLTGFQRLIQLFAVLWEMSLLPGQEDLEVKKFLSVNTAYVRRVEQVYQIIQKEYQNDLSTREIAHKLSMTESSFCRFFKNATGKTFKTALTEVRIEKASAHLLHSDLSVASISSQCGFNNVSLFNRFFKELTGRTPNNYRRSIRFTIDAGMGILNAQL
jgi:AraC-like DNA-binding protein/mannose-6-phosphate isomerase-like protein (cupin superfamily)